MNSIITSQTRHSVTKSQRTSSPQNNVARQVGWNQRRWERRGIASTNDDLSNWRYNTDDTLRKHTIEHAIASPCLHLCTCLGGLHARPGAGFSFSIGLFDGQHGGKGAHQPQMAGKLALLQGRFHAHGRKQRRYLL